MTSQSIAAGVLALSGVGCLTVAVVNERLMHRHRQSGVTYADATLRRDGGWRRADLFTADGLRHQRRASAWGVTGAALLVASVFAWVMLGSR